MFRPVLNSARRTAVNAARQTRFNSSSSSSAGGDTRWMIASAAITIPALGYLLAPPDKKAQVHKKAHAAAADVGLKEAEPEEAAAAVPDEHHGPDSRSSHSEKEQSPESKREQASKVSTPAKSGDDKPGREDGATKPSGGDIGSKQSGLSNTQTKHMVPAVIKEGENPSAKSGETIEPRNSRGTEKDGPSGDSSSSSQEDKTPDADKDTEASRPLSLSDRY